MENHKQCIKCRETKAKQEFYPKRTRCIICTRKDNKDYYIENREKRLLYQKEFREQNPNYSKEYQEKNKLELNRKSMIRSRLYRQMVEDRKKKTLSERYGE